MKHYYPVFIFLFVNVSMTAMEDASSPNKIQLEELTEQILQHLQLSYELPKDQTNTALITTVSYSPNGRLIAAGSKDGTVYIWDTFTKKLLHTFSHQARINDMSWNSKSSCLAVATKHGLYAYDTVTWKIHASNTEYNCKSVCYKPDDGELAVCTKQGGYDKTNYRAIMLFNSAMLTFKAKYVTNLMHLSDSLSVLEKLEKNLQRLYLHWADNELVILKSDAKSITGTGFRVTCSSRPLVAPFSPNNNLIAVGTQDGTIYIIDLENRTLRHFKKAAHASPIKALCWNSNSNRIATVTERGIDVWDTKSTACIYTLKECANASCVCWHAENFVAAGIGNTVQVWHIIDRQLAETSLQKQTSEQTQLLTTLNQLKQENAPDAKYYTILKEFDSTFTSLNPLVCTALKKLFPPVERYYRNSLTTPAKTVLGLVAFIGGYIAWSHSHWIMDKLLG